MVRRIIAGTAVAGVLTLGVSGIAAGATSSTATGATSSTASASGVALSVLCARVPTLESRLHTYEGKVAARLPKAEAREAKAKAAGHTEVADAIARRITLVQNHESRLDARLAKLEAKCPASGATGSGLSGTTSG